MEQENRYAYVTAVNSESYLPGVYALDKNLKDLNSSHALHVMVPETEGNIRSQLERRGINTLTLPNIELECLSKLGSHYWAKTFFKLQVFCLYQFDRVVLLDCDILVLKNLDSLFALPQISASSVGPAIGLRGEAWQGLTSGVMTLEPSNNSYSRVMSAIEEVVESKISKGHKAGDQDVINLVFGQIWARDSRRKLPETYNLIWSFLEEYCIYHLPNGLLDVAVVHFSGSTKPWHYTDAEAEELRERLADEGKHCMLSTFDAYRNLLAETA